MTEAESKKFLNKLERYLLSHFQTKIAEKIKDMIAEKLGCKGWWNLVKLDYPYKKVVELIGMGFGLTYFAFYRRMNERLGLNPYNPADPEEREQYVHYVLYSWACGTPGYIYQFSQSGKEIRADANSVDARLHRQGY